MTLVDIEQIVKLMINNEGKQRGSGRMKMYYSSLFKHDDILRITFSISKIFKTLFRKDGY